MSIRQGLLALLEQAPMYGAQLRSEFESRTGGTWPLNVGQVYTTLSRLERDGLVEGAGGADDEGRIAYRLTEQGRTEVQRWWAAPVERPTTPRDELVIKLALAVTVPSIDMRHVIQTQRTATLRQLQALTKLKRSTPDESGSAPMELRELGWLLVLDNLVFAAEAEIRWLDHIETRLAREAMRAAEARARSTVRSQDDPVSEDAVRPEDAVRSADAVRSEGAWR
jgi:DNA-binding PadR family transcriptional regulator